MLQAACDVSDPLEIRFFGGKVERLWAVPAAIGITRFADRRRTNSVTNIPMSGFAFLGTRICLDTIAIVDTR